MYLPVLFHYKYSRKSPFFQSKELPYGLPAFQALYRNRNNSRHPSIFPKSQTKKTPAVMTSAYVKIYSILSAGISARKLEPISLIMCSFYSSVSNTLLLFCLLPLDFVLNIVLGFDILLFFEFRPMQDDEQPLKKRYLRNQF